MKNKLDKKLFESFLILFFIIFNAFFIQAHEIRPARLIIKESQPGWFEISWKNPAKGNLVLGIEPVLPTSLELVGQEYVIYSPGAYIVKGTYKLAEGIKSLKGDNLYIKGLRSVQTDVFVKITFLDGVEYSTLLKSRNPNYPIPLDQTVGKVSYSYWKMGFEHILEGYDHLLFILGMIFLLGNRYRSLFKVITAFTIAHSLTLVLASLNIIHVASAPTETVIALSIVLLAYEIMQKLKPNKGNVKNTYNSPWMIAFIFGLVHGFGFSSALTEIGLPQKEITYALLSFNIGVETGQVLFAFFIIVLKEIFERIIVTKLKLKQDLLPRLIAFSIGGIGAFWTIDRLAALV